MRRLLIVPIVHSQSELGSLATAASEAKVARLGIERAQQAADNVEQFWQLASEVLQKLQIPLAEFLVYQDGLPVIENAALQLERRIVEDLARSGSPNHRLVKWLIEQGACLVGTESAPLLMKEYAMIREAFAKGPGNTHQQPGHNDSVVEDETDQRQSEPSLLEQRDRFIAQRIDGTLGNTQVGILFIGMLHRVENFLPPDIDVEYPIGKPTLALCS